MVVPQKNGHDKRTGGQADVTARWRTRAAQAAMAHLAGAVAMALCLLSGACSDREAANQSSSGAKPESSDRLCGIGMQIDEGSRTVTIRGRESVSAQNGEGPGGQETDLCRALLALNRGSELQIHLTPISTSALRPRVITCVRHHNGLALEQLRTSREIYRAEAILDISSYPGCWAIFVAEHGLKLPKSLKAKELVTSSAIASEMKRRREESLVSRTGVYDDAYTSIPVQLIATSDDVVHLHCLAFLEEPPATDISFQHLAVSCVRRTSG